MAETSAAAETRSPKFDARFEVQSVQGMISHRRRIRCGLTEDHMTTITLQEAQANLADLIHRLSPGEEVVILEGDRPVATLSVATRGEPSVQGEWWAALQRVQASQTARGFAGIASNINRDDAQYDDRMRKIDQNTMSGDGSRSCGST